ncbi:MAG: hypothetical protein PHO57_07370 [Acidithiobacillus sp.]|nr:hypothetical protein [Acidithiobacillus sp.]
MNWYFIAGLAIAFFQMGWAGVLTVRVAEYSFCGQLWLIFYPLFWFLFFVTGLPLLLIALPFRLIGIKMYPAFIPDSVK